MVSGQNSRKPVWHSCPVKDGKLIKIHTKLPKQLGPLISVVTNLPLAIEIHSPGPHSTLFYGQGKFFYYVEFALCETDPLQTNS